MIEDMRHLEVLDGLAHELSRVLNHYNELCNGITDKGTLVQLRLKQNEQLVELLKGQKRALQFMRGDPVEPEVHFGEGVLIGVGGGAT